jgi:peptide/nickel transport system permease protein
MSDHWHPLCRMALQRCIQAFLVAALVGTLTYFLTYWLPGDMAYRVAAARYGYDMVDTAAAAAVRAELGLDGSMWAGWLRWMTALATLDLGRSVVSGEAITHVLAHELGHTVLLACAALGLALLMAVPIGFVAGWRPNGWLDRLTTVAALGMRATPAFVVGLLLVILLSVESSLLPGAGHGTASNLWLPALTLAVGLAAVTARVTRDATVDVISSDYYRFAQLKGLRESLALFRHAPRNIAVPVVAYLGVQLVVLIEGVVIVETLFAWPGIGHALVHAVFARDVPMLQGTALVLGLLFVVLNGVVDVLCWLLDPRQRRREPT